MKLEAKQVRFRRTAAWFGRRRLLFAGTHNTIQLLETALVIEGHLQRFYFFLIDLFFRMPLSEWTTVTVPYSRILRFKYSSMIVMRSIVYTLLWLPIALLLLVALGDGVERFILEGRYLAVLIPAVPAAGLTLLCQMSWLASRHYLWFRQADGKPALVAFRIRSKKRRLAFEAQLNEYRRATRAKGVAVAELSEAELAAPSPGVWLVLLLYVLGHQMVVPLYQQWSLLGGASFWLAVPRALTAVLPPLLVSLVLVSRRSEVVRWAATLMLALAGLLPTFRLVLFTPPVPPEIGRELVFQAVVSALFHLTLAVTLTLVTGARRKKEELP